MVHFFSHGAWLNFQKRPMGAVHIASRYPNFNGSHFGLQPSSIEKITGLGGKMMWTMTHANMPHFLYNLVKKKKQYKRATSVTQVTKFSSENFNPVFHARGLSTFSIPWWKKGKNGRELKSRGLFVCLFVSLGKPQQALTTYRVPKVLN